MTRVKLLAGLMHVTSVSAATMPAGGSCLDVLSACCPACLSSAGMHARKHGVRTMQSSVPGPGSKAGVSVILYLPLTLSKGCGVALLNMPNR